MTTPPPYVPALLFGIAAISSIWRLVELHFTSRTNAVVLLGGSDLRSLLERSFLALILIASFFVAAYAYDPRIVRSLGELTSLGFAPLAWFGVLLSGAGALLIAAAQFNMGRSWRVGIARERTTLITSGIYRFSRNPIYLGMAMSLAGVFLIAPNAVTLSLLTMGCIAMSAQIRLEEEQLSRMHGDLFTAYFRRTRRWI